MKIIVRVKELRKHHNLTQEELAKQLNISRQSLISLEQGRWLPSLPLAVQLADFFQTPIEQVIYVNPIEANKRGKEAIMPRELGPWSPFRELRDMREEIDRIFDQSVHAPANVSVGPAINIKQDEQNVYLEAHVPGFTQEAIDIDIAEDMVTISGTLSAEDKQENKKAGYIRQEYRQESFSRTVGLPTPVVSDKAMARLDHGILRITLPKIAEEKPKMKRIKPNSE